MIIEIDGISIEIIKKNIKNMTLRIYPPDGRVRVSAPVRFSDQLIRKHLTHKSEWIKTQRERMKARPLCKEEALVTGATIPFKGRNYLLIVEEHHGPSQLVINNELIHFYVPTSTTPTQRQMLLDQWYKKEMALILPDLIEHWSEIIKVSVAEWGIKKMKTRWGSCNTRAHRIWLNSNLMKKPQICLEYVLVHELVHLHEASHNKRFYTLMTEFMPQWQEYQLILENKKSCIDVTI